MWNGKKIVNSLLPVKDVIDDCDEKVGLIKTLTEMVNIVLDSIT